MTELEKDMFVKAMETSPKDFIVSSEIIDDKYEFVVEQTSTGNSMTYDEYMKIRDELE